MRQLPGYEECPIIALSADAVDEAKERAQNAGMDGFLEKPLQPAELHGVLSGFFPLKDEQADVPAAGETSVSKNNPRLLAVQEAVSRLGGDQESYRKILRLFLQADYPCDFAQISRWTKEELTDYVHKLKGSAANIGAECLVQESKRVLSCIGKKKIEKKDWCGYQKLLADTAEAVQKYLRLFQEEITQQTDGKVDFIQLDKLLRQGNIEAKEKFLAHKGEYKKVLGPMHYARLSQKIIQYDFGTAAELLRKWQRK